MEDRNGTSSGDAEAQVEADATNGMAYADVAPEAEEEDDLSQPCRLCGKGDDGRAMVRFRPVQVDLNVAHAATSTNTTTFLEDITLHVFCGKTASILPNVQMPQYEILSKAGIKNKHGIGSEVNGALSRTRCANVAPSSGAKEKTFYIVQEFEANLLAIRSAHQDQHSYTFSPEIALQVPSSPHDAHHIYAPPEQYQYPMPAHHEQQAQPHHVKPSPVRAAAGAVHKPGRRPPQEHYMYAPQQYDTVAVTSDGKIRCACGGTHLPTGSAKGASSWRSHVMTKRHQKWMEDNGLLGAV